MFALKLLILAASSAALAQCAYLAAPAIPAAVSTGVSAQTRSQDSLGNYRFAYDIVDHLGARNGRSESGDALGNKVGSYSIADIDGRVRRVDYVADDYGFRASIQTNEQGTAPSNTGGATYNPPLVAAPVAVAGKCRLRAPPDARHALQAPLLTARTVYHHHHRPTAPAIAAYPAAVAAPAPAVIDSMAKLLAPGVPAYGASPLYGFARKA